MQHAFETRRCILKARLQFSRSSPTMSTTRSNDDLHSGLSDESDEYPTLVLDTSSSIASDATAPNLPGSGRVLGHMLDRFEARLESFLNVWASRLADNPEAVAREIRRLRRLDEIPFTGPSAPVTDSEKWTIKKLLKKLLKFLRLGCFVCKHL